MQAANLSSMTCYFVAASLASSHSTCSYRIPKQSLHLLYCDHVEEHGEELFRLACEHDLEGIVAKHKSSPCLSGGGETTWLKIRNPNYSQLAGRDELFNRDGKRRQEQASDGWSGCVLACIEGRCERAYGTFTSTWIVGRLTIMRPASS
jgi:hypothetical protein